MISFIYYIRIPGQLLINDRRRIQCFDELVEILYE